MKIEEFKIGNSRHIVFKKIEDIAPWQDIGFELLKLMESSPKCQLVNRALYIHLNGESDYSISRSYTGSLSVPSEQYEITDFEQGQGFRLPINIEILYDTAKLDKFKNEFSSLCATSGVKKMSVWIRVQTLNGQIVAEMENFFPMI